MPATKYGLTYIWTRYPLPKKSTFKLSSFNFDTPSIVLFFSSIAAVIALMKIFTFLGSRLGLPTCSEELVLLPTRFSAPIGA